MSVSVETISPVNLAVDADGALEQQLALEGAALAEQGVQLASVQRRPFRSRSGPSPFHPCALPCVVTSL